MENPDHIDKGKKSITRMTAAVYFQKNKKDTAKEEDEQMTNYI